MPAVYKPPKHIVPGTLLGSFPAGLFPYNCCFDGQNIWVTNNYDKNNDVNTVTKLNTGGQTIGTFVVGFNPAAICFDGSHIWTACGADGGGTVSKSSLAGVLLASYVYPGNPLGICFDGTSIWITLFSSASVVKLNLSGVQQLTVAVGAGPCNVFFDGTSIWVSNNGMSGGSPANTVTKIRPSDGTVLGTFTVGNFPYGVCSDSAGNLYVAIGAVVGFIMMGAGSIIKLSPTGTILGTFALSGNPFCLAYDGMHIWATQLTGASVSVLDTTGTVLNTYPTGTYPTGLCFDQENNCYVCNQLSTTVSKVSSYDLKSVQNTLTSNLTAPAIGTAHNGVALTTTNGTWWKDLGSYTYQWQISSTSQGGQTLPGGLIGFESIVGQTTHTYTPVAGDIGNYVRCQVNSGQAVAYSNQSLVNA